MQFFEENMGNGKRDRGRIWVKNWAEKQVFDDSHRSKMTPDPSAPGLYVHPCVCLHVQGRCFRILSPHPQCLQQGNLGAPCHGANVTVSNIFT